MKKTSMITSSIVSGVMIAGIVASPVLACHPQGKIVKDVQDNTTNSEMVNANVEADALSVNQGDTLMYTVTISNQETVEGNHNEADMTNVVLTDTLPSGVQMVSNPAQTTITENIGTIAAKGKVTKTYQVKVTEKQDGAVLTNKACYTSGSNLGTKYAQNGCEVAIVKVNVPVIPTPTPTPTPTTTPTPTHTAPVTPAAPTALPSTGAGNIIVPVAIVTIIGYALNVLRLKRKTA